MAVQFFFDTKKPLNALPSPVDDGHIILNGTGTGTLFLIHGLTGTPNEMRYLANFFHKKKGYTVVCPGLPIMVPPEHTQKIPLAGILFLRARGFLQVRQELTAPYLPQGFPWERFFRCCWQRNSRTGGGRELPVADPFYDGWNIPWYSKILLPLFYATPLKHVAYFKEEPPYGIKNKALQKRIHKYYNTATFQDQQGVPSTAIPTSP